MIWLWLPTIISYPLSIKQTHTHTHTHMCTQQTEGKIGIPAGKKRVPTRRSAQGRSRLPQNSRPSWTYVRYENVVFVYDLRRGVLSTMHHASSASSLVIVMFSPAKRILSNLCLYLSLPLATHTQGVERFESSIQRHWSQVEIFLSIFRPHSREERKEREERIEERGKEREERGKRGESILPRLIHLCLNVLMLMHDPTMTD